MAGANVVFCFRAEWETMRMMRGGAEKKSTAGYVSKAAVGTTLEINK
jgi:hypothetical protein